MKFPEDSKNEEGYKITAERIKEAVEFIFKQEPREKAKKGKGSYLSVVDNKEYLAIKLKSDVGMSFTTGIRGFYNMLDAEGNWVYRILPIKYNGVVLDDEQTKQFWEQIDKFRENE